MSERPHRFEVNSKGEAHDVGIRDLRNKLYPLLAEAREIVESHPDMAGMEEELIYTMMIARFDEEELGALSDELITVTSHARYVSEKGEDLNAFMEGDINWGGVVVKAWRAASKDHA